MNAAELLDRVFDIYKKSFAKQLAYAAVVSVAASMVAGFIIFGVSFTVIFMSLLTSETIGVFAIFIIVGVTVFMVLVWQAAASAGAIYISRQAFTGSPIFFPMSNLFRMIVRTVCALLATVVVAVPYLLAAGGILYTYFRFAFDLYSTYPVVYVVFGVILTLFVLVGFFVYMHVFSLAIAVAVFENVWFTQTLRRSYDLIKNDFWRLFGVRLIWWLIIFTIVMCTQGLMGLLPAVAGIFAAGNTLSVPFLILLQMFTGLVSIVISFVMGPLEGIFTAVVYFNQRIRYEGFDMEIAIEGLYNAL
jgi:hypothetical protein